MQRQGTPPALAAALLLVLAPGGAPAAPTGLAWDSVTKFSMSADPSKLQPGVFDADYAAAAAEQSPSSGGGIFGQVKQVAEMEKMLQTGIAQRHYIAGSRERTDDVVAQKATI
ncbi:MAG: hypothetical protein JO104_10610, partial [Candidatus Eremiobacteraeota bacterium]|nr:hypothetical protein [Candidatus Eremiobacteraeota bacterium]